MSPELLVVGAVVTVRLTAPLMILRYPLPGLVFSAFVIDSVDRDIYHRYLDITEMQYQRFDKTLDVYYLCFAYLAMLRHWRSPTALSIGRALFYYRLVGVAIFELTGARWVLALFPNAYEFFFLFYEIVRIRWRLARLTLHRWALAAGIITAVILVKEIWVHVLVIDTATVVRANASLAAAIAFALMLAAVAAWRFARPQLPAPDLRASLRVRTEVGDRPLLHRLPGRRQPQGWLPLVEVMVLVSLVTTIAIHGLGRSADVGALVLGTVVLVLLHPLLGRELERPGDGWSSMPRELPVVLAVNGAVVALAAALLAAAGVPLDPVPPLIFVVLLTLFVLLYERSLATREAAVITGDVPRLSDGRAAH